MTDIADWLEMIWTEGDVTYQLSGRMGLHGPELHAVQITGGPLTARHLRAPVISIFTTNFGLSEGEIRPLAIRRGRPRDASAATHRLEEVAEVVRSAPAGKRGQLVAERFNISPGYARQLISSAEKAGLTVR